MLLTFEHLIAAAWENVAVNNRVGLISGHTWTSPARITVILRARMRGRMSLFTDTDLAEATFGLVTYFLSVQAAFAVNITVARPNERGTVIPVGDIEIQYPQPGPGVIGASEGNVSVETA